MKRRIRKLRHEIQELDREIFVAELEEIVDEGQILEMYYARAELIDELDWILSPFEK